MMKKIKRVLIKLLVSIIVILLVAFIGCYIMYNRLIGAVDKTNTEPYSLVVESNDTYYSIVNELLENKLIKSELVYKIYIKLNNPNNLQVGIYSLNSSMSLNEIVDILNGGSTYNPYIVSITIKEGLNVRQIAKIVEENTENTYEDFMNKMDDNAYMSSLVDEYWFLTNDILNNKIYYPLEGYLFPETYQISSKYTVEQVIKTLLDQTNKVLTPYKSDIEKGKYNIHEIMTLASIVELESGNSKDRPGIAGVFYNRINNAGYTIGSDITTYYALKIDDFKHSLTKSEVQTCDYAYNTRCLYFADLPVGPVGNPGEDAIKAAIYPTNHNYFYFVADCKGNTYFTKSLEEHNSKISELKNQNNWCS